MKMKKPRLEDRAAPAPSATGERLCVALTCGVTELLGSADVVRVLITNRLIRSDAGLVGCALRRVTSDPRWRWCERTPPTPAAVQLAWHIQALLISTEPEPSTHTASGSLHPFVLPVPIAADGSPHGNALTRALPIPIHHVPLPSGVSAHWDHIDANGCALCEACVASVCAYREATEAFTSEFERLLTQHEDQWEAQGGSSEEVFDQSFTFQQAYFASEPFYSAYVANQDDAAVLAHICQCGRFPVDVPVQVGDTALSRASRETCRRVYRPVKKLLTTLCASLLVRRTMSDHEQPMDVVVGVCGRLAVGFLLPLDA